MEFFGSSFISGHTARPLVVLLAAVALVLLPGLAAREHPVDGGRRGIQRWQRASGSTPWITVDINDHGGVGSVTFTLTATHLTATENVSELDINLDPGLYADLPLTFSSPVTSGAFDTPLVSQAIDGFTADGDGIYDINLTFTTGGTVSQTFTQGDVLEYTITGAGLVATSFQFLSTPHGGHGPFVMAAHIQNTPGGGGSSGWVADDTGGVVHGDVPEPTTATLAALGAMGLLAAAWTRRRRS